MSLNYIYSVNISPDFFLNKFLVISLKKIYKNQKTKNLFFGPFSNQYLIELF